MTENTTELKIAALIQAWNDVTKQNCNPLRFINQGQTFLEAGVTPEEMTIVAKYMVRQNANASEVRYKAQLNLYNLMVNLAKFDSILQLAKGIARNQVKPSAKSQLLTSIHRPEMEVDNTKRVSADLLATAIKQLEKQ